MKKIKKNKKSKITQKQRQRTNINININSNNKKTKSKPSNKIQPNPQPTIIQMYSTPPNVQNLLTPNDYGIARTRQQEGGISRLETIEDNKIHQEIKNKFDEIEIEKLIRIRKAELNIDDNIKKEKVIRKKNDKVLSDNLNSDNNTLLSDNKKQNTINSSISDGYISNLTDNKSIRNIKKKPFTSTKLIDENSDNSSSFDINKIPNMSKQEINNNIIKMTNKATENNKVLNPYTGRQIEIGGKVYNDIKNDPNNPHFKEN